MHETFDANLVNVTVRREVTAPTACVANVVLGGTGERGSVHDALRHRARAAVPAERPLAVFDGQSKDGMIATRVGITKTAFWEINHVEVRLARGVPVRVGFLRPAVLELSCRLPVRPGAAIIHDIGCTRRPEGVHIEWCSIPLLQKLRIEFRVKGERGLVEEVYVGEGAVPRGGPPLGLDLRGRPQFLRYLRATVFFVAAEWCIAYGA
mmetsp:Transcript_96864/g.274334  ORF Transcript_96864/g.274334 Transcript_96864/m.274334 type:complete len:208 (+) Transcript_96864:394-1017(+)